MKIAALHRRVHQFNSSGKWRDLSRMLSGAKHNIALRADLKLKPELIDTIMCDCLLFD